MLFALGNSVGSQEFDSLRSRRSGRHGSSIAGVVAVVCVVFRCMPLLIMLDWIGSVAVLLKVCANRLPASHVCVRFERFRHCVIGGRL